MSPTMHHVFGTNKNSFRLIIPMGDEWLTPMGDEFIGRTADGKPWEGYIIIGIEAIRCEMAFQPTISTESGPQNG